MIVFSEVRYDGRVLRTAEALARDYDVILSGLGDCPICLETRIRYLQVCIPSSPRWLSHVFFFVKTILIGLRVQPDIVHAHDYFVVLHGWIIAKMNRAVCIYDAHEFLPGIKERSHVRHWLFASLERISINRYDMIIATSEERAQVLRDYYSLREPPVVVKNFSSVEEYTLESDTESFEYPIEDILEQGLPLVVYQGDMNIHSRCLDNLLRAFVGLQDKCILIMAGDGPDLDHLQKLSDVLELQGYVFFTGKLPKGHLMTIMRAASVGVVIYSNKETNNLLCTPNKIHEYVQAGLAVVASNQPPLVQMLGVCSIGEIFVPEESDSIRRAILKVLSHLENYRINIPEFLAHYSWDDEKQKLLKAYKSLKKFRCC